MPVLGGTEHNRAGRNSDTLSVNAGAGSDTLFDVQPRPLLEVPFEPAKQASSVGGRLSRRQRILLTSLYVSIEPSIIDTHRVTM